MAAIKNITTPDFGGAADVTVIEILAKPGDQLTPDTPLLTLESDKATMDLPAGETGSLKELKVKVGDKVSTGSILATIETNGEAKAPTPAKEASESTTASAETAKTAAKKTKPEKKVKSKKEELKEDLEEEEVEEAEVEEAEIAVEEHQRKPVEDKDNVLTGTIQSDSDIHAGPGVRRLARELGVNLSQVGGSGPKSRILKEDVQSFVKKQLQLAQSGSTNLPALPAIDFTKFGAVERQALSRIQKISGKNLQRNWMMIPHVTQFGEADITSLEEFRIAQKADFEKHKVKLTPLVFVMKAVVASLKAFPQFNASLDPNGENLILKKYFNLGVAVDTPDGLVVPVIRDVDKKGMRELAKELAEVSEKARKKQLLPGDMQGGCFSISSLGGIGGTAFTPIINYPEVAILGVSKSYYKPVYEEGQFVPRLMLPLSLSYDHRVVDGADGARFMMYLSGMLSDIRNLLL